MRSSKCFGLKAIKMDLSPVETSNSGTENNSIYDFFLAYTAVCTFHNANVFIVGVSIPQFDSLMGSL